MVISMVGSRRFPSISKVVKALERSHSAQAHIEALDLLVKATHTVEQTGALTWIPGREHPVRVRPLHGLHLGRFWLTRLQKLSGIVSKTLFSVGRKRVVGNKATFVFHNKMKKRQKGAVWVVVQPNNAHEVATQIYNRFLDRIPRCLPELAATEFCLPSQRLGQMANEIDEFSAKCEPSKERQNDIAQLLKLLKQQGGGLLGLFGSHTYQLTTPMSDVDISTEDLPRVTRVMRQLGFRVVEVKRARVPITKFTYKGISGDVSMGPTGVAKSNILKMCVAADPRVRPFLLVLKMWAHRRQLYGPVNSFTIVLMGLAFLVAHKVVPPLQSLSNHGASFSASPNLMCTARLLYEMFSFYGTRFDPLKNAVSLRLGSTTVPRMGLTTSEPGFLVIEDPMETQVNCACNASAEWVEAFLWEMRRAAWVLSLGPPVLNRLFLAPSKAIYGDAGVWASAYPRLLSAYQSANNARVFTGNERRVDLKSMEDKELQ
ncbi:hypothetical protein GGI25_004196 [Coemansia spiralis]|uniref:PAP-associated domain-containing protein n=2 Tax=Coemansia TaxID=4863 RepID=A0A9W8G727_9FUNG|nr:hypothetical protein BX070DRAFT_221029 [Coemansia spiralis]KAJ1990228.1 hypothetical protein EDC05_004175 [Coemansia umbellata]KAJ2624996.1 hypothetical protein GGI26_001108 [Coemansia sp. RSA 1358]KAJ2674809.1 hypothetical protein GGI25_004196 [Coemansia spiralis]